MIHLLSRLESAFPFLHRRPATENDFFEYAAGNIEAVFSNLVSTGVYVLYDGKHYIFLNNKLRGWFLRYVMFHELGHHLFHVPSQSSYGVEFVSVHSKQKNHLEAEAVAALLLLPLVELENVIDSGAYNAFPEFAELVKVRLAIFDNYRL